MTYLATFEINLNDDDILKVAYAETGIFLRITDDGDIVSLTPYEQEFVDAWASENYYYVNSRISDNIRFLMQ
jgi:hypothetical protein